MQHDAYKVPQDLTCVRMVSCASMGNTMVDPRIWHTGTVRLIGIMEHTGQWQTCDHSKSSWQAFYMQWRGNGWWMSI